MRKIRFKTFKVALVASLIAGSFLVQAQIRPIAPHPKDAKIMEEALDYYKKTDVEFYETHDPIIIKEDDTYYLSRSGGEVATSKDLKDWKFSYYFFDEDPVWVTPQITGANERTAISATRGSSGERPGQQRKGRVNAPDIQLVNGTYYLYYNVTSFAKNTSAIGVATNKTLNPESPEFEWVDHGMVIQSIPYRDMWNAIDANLVMDGNQGWLVFGSFWGGIQMLKLAPDLLSVAKPEFWHHIAAQPRNFYLDWADPGDGAIEGAFIYKHIQYFYLFASLDYCCRGIESDYKIIVGRSRYVEGPYVDKEGRQLSMGGGTLVVEGNDRWAAVGHNSAYTMNGKSIIVMHGYDKLDSGKSKLLIREIKWGRDDWPIVDL
ncbi:MAG TPA: family 43 glycosylhydrolase [Draconibacterium sp.]|nr:family 43 glycosylhydrolase [Draconibacterium sp.]